MKVGYARISTATQNLQMQIDALEKEKCDRIFTEVMTGSRYDRPEWRRCMDVLRNGDTLVIWAIDRMGRNLKEQVFVIDQLYKKGVIIKSLSQSIDSTTIEGRFFINHLSVMADMERERITQRTKAGKEAARARGVRGGRKFKHKAREQALIKEMYHSKKYTLKEIADMHNISVSTIYNYVK